MLKTYGVGKVKSERKVDNRCIGKVEEFRKQEGRNERKAVCGRLGEGCATFRRNYSIITSWRTIKREDKGKENEEEEEEEKEKVKEEEEEGGRRITRTRTSRKKKNRKSR